MNETIVRRSERSNKGVAPQRDRATNNMALVAEPTSYDEAVNSPESKSLIAVMEEEMQSHLYQRKLDEHGRVTR